MNVLSLEKSLVEHVIVLLKRLPDLIFFFIDDKYVVEKRNN